MEPALVLRVQTENTPLILFMFTQKLMVLVVRPVQEVSMIAVPMILQVRVQLVTQEVTVQVQQLVLLVLQAHLITIFPPMPQRPLVNLVPSENTRMQQGNKRVILLLQE